MSSFITFLENIDRWLFIHINNYWTNSFLDNIVPVWRDAYFWGPLYLFILVFMLVNFGKKSWPWIIGFILCFAITDQLSAHFLKYWVGRPRPCNDEALIPYLHELLGYCPGNPSFPSSHATNHFGLACFAYYTLKPYIKKWGYLFFVWAFTISYGQIYAGVHYPSDVLGGAIIGSAVGCGLAYLYNRYIGLDEPITQYA